MLTDIPLIDQTGVHYLDNAATTQKPQHIIDAEKTFYETSNANPHRSMYGLANDATRAVEEARETYADALNADSHEVYFTRTATESLNHLAHGFKHGLDDASTILISEYEHHSNLLPWQQVAEETGATLRIIPHDDINGYEAYLDDVDIVALTHMSNVTGRILPVQAIASHAKQHSDAIVICDGCQAYPHRDVDVEALGVDAYTFSAHKHYGPTGVGITYVASDLHDSFEPLIVGGGMVDAVTKHDYEASSAPHRFEAGTLNAAGITAAAEAARLVESNRDQIRGHEDELLSYVLRRLNEAGIQYYGHDTEKYGPVVSIKSDHDALDIAHILDEHDVCVRAGNHCADPLMDALHTTNTARISLAHYNDEDDIDAAINALQDAYDLLGGTT